jgi:hypothetical protein
MRWGGGKIIVSKLVWLWWARSCNAYPPSGSHIGAPYVIGRVLKLGFSTIQRTPKLSSYATWASGLVKAAHGLELKLLWGSTLGTRTKLASYLLLHLETLVGLSLLHSMHHSWTYAWVPCPHQERCVGNWYKTQSGKMRPEQIRVGEVVIVHTWHWGRKRRDDGTTGMDDSEARHRWRWARSGCGMCTMRMMTHWWRQGQPNDSVVQEAQTTVGEVRMTRASATRMTVVRLGRCEGCEVTSRFGADDVGRSWGSVCTIARPRRRGWKRVTSGWLVHEGNDNAIRDDDVG